MKHFIKAFIIVTLLVFGIYGLMSYSILTLIGFSFLIAGVYGVYMLYTEIKPIFVYYIGILHALLTNIKN